MRFSTQVATGSGGVAHVHVEHGLSVDRVAAELLDDERQLLLLLLLHLAPTLLEVRVARVRLEAAQLTHVQRPVVRAELLRDERAELGVAEREPPAHGRAALGFAFTALRRKFQAGTFL